MSLVRTIRIPEDLYEKAIKKAAEDNRSVNNWIVNLIAKAVEDDNS